MSGSAPVPATTAVAVVVAAGHTVHHGMHAFIEGDRLVLAEAHAAELVAAGHAHHETDPAPPAQG